MFVLGHSTRKQQLSAKLVSKYLSVCQQVFVLSRPFVMNDNKEPQGGKTG